MKLWRSYIMAQGITQVRAWSAAAVLRAAQQQYPQLLQHAEMR